MPRRILIVGGSLSGAAAAARIRTLDSQAEIILFEKGTTITYAGTAWPGMLADDALNPRDSHSLTAEQFQRQYRVDVRTNSEVTRIHRLRRLVDVRPASDIAGKQYREKYDYLVLATGCVPELPKSLMHLKDGVFTIKSPADALQIRAWMTRPDISQAVILGGTVTGLETAVALSSRGLGVTVVESSNHVIERLDPDQARIVENQLTQKGIQLKLSRQILRVHRDEGRFKIQYDNQTTQEADLIIAAVSMKPNNDLALKTGLKTGFAGTVQVNSGGQTSDRRIFAVGALTAAVNKLNGQPIWLSSIAAVTRQARQTADYICGRHTPPQPRQVNNVMHFFTPGLEAGSIGATENDLVAMKTPYNRTYTIQPGDDSQPFLAAKLIWSPQSRQILGAQLVSGQMASDKIALLAMAVQLQLPIDELSRLEMPHDIYRPGRRNWLVSAGQLAINQLEKLVTEFSIYELAGPGHHSCDPDRCPAQGRVSSRINCRRDQSAAP